MYTVTVDVAAPADVTASPSDVDAVCAELERLVTLPPWSGRIRRLECLESPSGIILAVTTADQPSADAARALVEELVAGAFADPRTTGWSVQSFTVLTDPVPTAATVPAAPAGPRTT